MVTSLNDNLSAGLNDLVPDKYKDKAQFLDIVQWNIEWFGARRSVEKDQSRFELAVRILEGSLAHPQMAGMRASWMP